MFDMTIRWKRLAPHGKTIVSKKTRTRTRTQPEGVSGLLKSLKALNALLHVGIRMGMNKAVSSAIFVF